MIAEKVCSDFFKCCYIKIFSLFILPKTINHKTGVIVTITLHQFIDLSAACRCSAIADCPQLDRVHFRIGCNVAYQKYCFPIIRFMSPIVAEINLRSAQSMHSYHFTMWLILTIKTSCTGLVLSYFLQ